ncbi:DUF3558 family protein [Nocardia sp. IBHARD005]|uniref:DUF3558 family protein n=1 Tax=Nocardia sp. IBHARD005 TaxID=3457765 RepID=UPI00405812D1
MTVYRRVGAALLIGLLAASVTVACGAEQANNSKPELSSQPTTTRSISAPVGDPPKQGPRTKIPVRWDPCVAIPDAVPSGQGFSPATRERSDSINSDYAFIGCRFTRKEDVRGQILGTGDLTVWSANVNLQQIRDREDEQEFTVNGRAGILYREAGVSMSCMVVLPGPDGIVQITSGSSIALTDWNACDHINEIASAIEPLIPK